MSPLLDPRVKLRHFALIVAIHDSGSLRKAAEELRITQAAASSLLVELEAALGAALFTRSRSGTEPTAIGRLLIDPARLILSNVRATVELARQSAEGERGEVPIGVLPSSALMLVPLAIKLARQTNPGIVVHAVEGSADQLLESLARGKIDLVIGRAPSEKTKDQFQEEVLMTEANEVVCRSDHPLAGRGKLRLSDLLDAEWILPAEGAYVRDDICATFVEASLSPPKPVLVTSALILRLALLQSSDMIGVLPHRAAMIHKARGTLAILNVKLEMREAPTLLLTRAEAILPPATRAFANQLHRASEILQLGLD
jgi:DNA-binding transcriptional LysR family regulator